MDNEIDLRGLAIDRGGTAQLHTRRHVLTRYVLPGALLLGFCSLIVWASRDVLWPPRPVTVVPVLATTAEVRRAGTPLFQAAGWIEPRPTPVRVAALAPGVVEELLVVEDQRVETGMAIAELVKDDAKLTLDRAAADLELRHAELDEARAALVAAETRFKQPVHLQAALGEAEALLAKTETLLKNLPFQSRRAVAELLSARKDYEGKLASQGVVAGVVIDVARSKFDSAQALVEELQDRDQSLKKERTALIQRRDALQKQLELLVDEIQARDAATAQVRAAQARVAQTQVVISESILRFDRMTVRAPVSGRVFRLIAEPGARIGSGMTQMVGHDGSTIVTLYRPEMLQVRVDVRFDNIPQVQLQQPVQIDNPALAAPVIGSVLFISSEADIQKNTLEVKIAIPDPPPVFKPEMLVDVTFLASQNPSDSKANQELRFYVPQQLIQHAGDTAFVWLADQSEGRARRTVINTGATGTSGLVEVTKGLTVSSRIISSSLDGLLDGSRIRVTREDDAIGTDEVGPANAAPAPQP